MGTQRDDLSPRNVAERLKEESKQRIERGKATAADQIDNVANALKSASRQLGGHSTLGSYTDRLAHNIESLGARLRHGSIDELMGDVQAAARRNPALFVAGGLALGVVLARLVRAAADKRDTYDVEYVEYDEFTTGASPARDIPDSGDFDGTLDPTRRTFGG